MDEKSHKVAGVLGGMGPDATVNFMTAVIKLTGADRDQDHIRMIIDHNPQVPDRQLAFSGDDSEIRQVLVEMALRLESAGADFLVMPCNTAHAFAEDARAAVNIPFLSIIEETTNAIGNAVENVGLLATTACVESCGYQEMLYATGRRIVLPSARDQERLTKLIFRVKSGDQSDVVDREMVAIADQLVRCGAECIVAGCTEIPLVLDEDDLGVPVLSSTDVLAKQTVRLGRGDES